MSYTITLIKIVSTLAAVSCGAIGSYWIYDGVQESKATIGMSATCTVRGITNENNSVTWDVEYNTRGGDRSEGQITMQVSSNHEVTRLKRRYSLSNSYPCLYTKAVPSDTDNGTDPSEHEQTPAAMLVWESLDGAWHMSVGIFMVLLFLVWLLSLPSWVPSCRRYCCACCVRTPEESEYLEDGVKPTLRLSVAVFISGLSGRLRRLSRLESTTDESPVCSICLEGYDGELATALDCLHHFHKDCLSEWLQHKFQCPICNQDPSNARNYRSRSKSVRSPFGANQRLQSIDSGVTELSEVSEMKSNAKVYTGNDLSVQTARTNTPYMELGGTLK